jgi:chloride channel protein, CIC family
MAGEDGIREDQGEEPAQTADRSPRGLVAALGGLVKVTTRRFRSRATGPRSERNLRALLWAMAPALDLRILGRTLLHAAAVGLAAGLIGAAFFAGLEHAQSFLLERLAGFSPLRAHGEQIVGEVVNVPLRAWLIVLLPALGGLVSGLVTELAPEARGGGGDATIHAFHHQGGVLRRRLIWVKPLASIFTLGSGGSGGREGPTMQIGGAIGSTLGRLLRVSPREQRVLMVAGVAAGLAAVFRTPLGAALLAAEVLYRDDFEAEVLVPAILASVIAYSVVIAIYGESILFAHAPRYPFVVGHLHLYAGLAVFIAVVAAVFLGTLRGVQKIAAKLPVPSWLRPALGGLALGAFAVPLILLVGGRVGTPGKALGILGGGYGAAQVAITGAAWLPTGWTGVEFLLFLCAAKLLATSLTIGSGGSAGDFGPSLVLGGLFGGAFGRAVALLLEDPRIDPGAFALVGMGTLYAGLARVPLAALILVCELAGSYDLLVPAMLAEGIAFVLLRRHSLYDAQLPTRADSPIHETSFELLAPQRVSAVMVPRAEVLRFETRTSLSAIVRVVEENHAQHTFPVVDAGGRMTGLISADSVIALRHDPELHSLTVAADLMQPFVRLRPEDDLQKAAELMVASGLKQLLVLDDRDALVGVLDEGAVARAFLSAMTKAPARGENHERDRPP